MLLWRCTACNFTLQNICECEDLSHLLVICLLWMDVMKNEGLRWVPVYRTVSARTVVDSGPRSRFHMRTCVSCMTRDTGHGTGGDMRENISVTYTYYGHVPTTITHPISIHREVVRLLFIFYCMPCLFSTIMRCMDGSCKLGR